MNQNCHFDDLRYEFGEKILLVEFIVDIEPYAKGLLGFDDDVGSDAYRNR